MKSTVVSTGRLRAGVCIIRSAFWQLLRDGDRTEQLQRAIFEVSTLKKRDLAGKDFYEQLQHLIHLYYTLGFGYSGMTVSTAGLRAESESLEDLVADLVSLLLDAAEANMVVLRAAG